MTTTTSISKTLAAICASLLALPLDAVRLDRIRSDQWHLPFLRIREAQAQSTGAEVVVAVIDTGVAPHPDLRGNLLSGADLTESGGDGRQDSDSHGTGVAGVIAAHGSGPDSGALGIASRSKIVPIRDRASVTQGSSDRLAQAVELAISRSVDVINVSSVGGPSPRLRRAIEAANKADVVIVASVGNSPHDLNIGFPAAYDGVLAVGATDRNGNHADFSVSGKQVAISAPGVDIYSTSIDGKYSKATGTSAATAIVAGAVALVRSKYPELSAREVVHRLTATATDKGPPGRDEQYGYGVLNIVAALTADVPPLGPPTNGPRATSTTATTADAAPRDGPDADGGGIGVWVAALGVVAGGAAAVLLALRRRARRDG